MEVSEFFSVHPYIIPRLCRNRDVYENETCRLEENTPYPYLQADADQYDAAEYRSLAGEHRAESAAYPEPGEADDQRHCSDDERGGESLQQAVRGYGESD